MKLLLTAFEPFGGETVNAAWEAVNLLPDRLGALEIIKRTVPTEFDRSIACVTAAVEAVCPDAVLILGSTFAVVFGEPMKGGRGKYLLSDTGL